TGARGDRTVGSAGPPRHTIVTGSGIESRSPPAFMDTNPSRLGQRQRHLSGGLAKAGLIGSGRRVCQEGLGVEGAVGRGGGGFKSARSSASASPTRPAAFGGK